MFNVHEAGQNIWQVVRECVLTQFYVVSKLLLFEPSRTGLVICTL